MGAIDLLYCPAGMDAALVADSHTAETWEFADGTMIIEQNVPQIEAPNPDDPVAWRAAVIATLEAPPIGAHLVDPDSYGWTILHDDHGVGFGVHGNGVNVFVVGIGSEATFPALWQAMQLVAEHHSCIAFWFDESCLVDLSLPTPEAREAYFLV